MKRSIVITLLLVSFSIGFGQHLTYSSFIKMTKIQEWGQLSDALGEYGYEFLGSDKNSNGGIEARQAVWGKNCKYDFSSGRYSFKRGVEYSSFVVMDYGEDKSYSYYFPNKSAYKTFITTAKKNGFKFLNENLSDNYIITFYQRYNKQNSCTEKLVVMETSDGSYQVTMSRYK